LTLRENPCENPKLILFANILLKCDGQSPNSSRHATATESASTRSAVEHRFELRDGERLEAVSRCLVCLPDLTLFWLQQTCSGS